ncbi:hypothetical protein PAE9249_04891 [Paenibacillus sp. CECT 9249]|uniref:hypothetical protein n=1 Tax=Paenibacillus sp. CECT 9249 TaxID=2845385 RepID=UPI001E3DD3B6|nr:hypothetical protein [Paenibacillus sp. CECT 9249]CAH0122341.1 hypothetical protein PAE9249_04891 [Paenibacillus sp. CECT 9249]
METAISKPVPIAMKRLIFGLAFLLLCVGGLGYGYWKGYPTLQLSGSVSPEQLYYKQMAYAVNEMHNQVIAFDDLKARGELAPADLEKGRTYVASLMAALTSAPEELSAAQYILEQLHQSYLQYMDEAEIGSSRLSASLELAETNYAKFRQNAELLSILLAYNGIDTLCH